MRTAILALTAATLALGSVVAPARAEAQLLGKIAGAAARGAARAGRRAAVGAAAGATAAATAPDSASAQQRPAASRPAASAAAPAAKPDSTKPAVRTVTRGGGETSVTKRGAAGELTFQREVYAYPGTGRRDPFMSLMKSGDLRPLLSDLKLVTVLYDPTGRNSVAILRDLSTKDQYRVKVGQQLGRMRVAQIQPKQLVFTIEEFGFSRQETLALTDINTTRTQ